jgi:hypothetical protein
MQLDEHYLYVNDILSPWLFCFEFNALNHANQYSFLCVSCKTQFPNDENIVLEAQLLRCGTNVSLFVLHFNLQLASILLLLFDVIPSVLFIYPSYIVMMSRHIWFQNIQNTTLHRAPKKKCETNTNKIIFVLSFWGIYFLILRWNACNM